jgi:hypothetical protein
MTLHAKMWTVGSHITDVVASGKVNPGAPGGLYEYYGKHPEEAVWFGRAMSRVTETMVGELAASGFRPLASGRIVDLGGGRGTLLAYLLGADPGATGVVFDRVEALAEAPQVLAGAGSVAGPNSSPATSCGRSRPVTSTCSARSCITGGTSRCLPSLVTAGRLAGQATRSW